MMMHDSTSMGRRSFLKGGIALGSAAALTALAGCAPNAQTKSEAIESTPQNVSAELPQGLTLKDFEATPVEASPIDSFDSEQTYDIVVVGAGTAGIPAVLTALEEGASVACVTKEAKAVSQGNGSCGVILEESNEAGIRQWMEGYRTAGSYRVNYELLDFFAAHSGEMVCWLRGQAEEVSFPPANTMYSKKDFDEGNYCTTVINMYGAKPQSNQDLIEKLAASAEAQGADIYYGTPAVRLIVDESGAVTGVIAKSDAGYVRFNAEKAVILATGDIQNNDSLMARFCPDSLNFAKKQQGKTGDGLLLGAMAGAKLTNGSFCRMAHDYDSAGMTMVNYPFMAVDETGSRFMNENIKMEWWDTQLLRRTVDDPGVFCRLFDSAYMEKYGAKTPVSTLENYIPGYLDNPEGVRADLVNVHRADTIDELAEMLDVPADQLKRSVDTWNEACETGDDFEFGLSRDLLKPLDTPPFWGIKHWIRVSAVYGGLTINGNCQVLNESGNPIPGLYAAGSSAGDICGDTEWNLFQGGMGCGWCITSGRYSAIHAVTGDMKPSSPGSYEFASADWAK